MKMMIRSALFALCLTGICVAQPFSHVYPVPPPGHGENGDWAYLGRYRKDNLALRPDRSRVVFLGDSITEGGAREPFIARNTHYVGCGVSGQT